MRAKSKKPRNWNIVNARTRTSAGPMSPKGRPDPDENKTMRDWETETEHRYPHIEEERADWCEFMCERYGCGPDESCYCSEYPEEFKEYLRRNK